MNALLNKTEAKEKEKNEWLRKKRKGRDKVQLEGKEDERRSKKV